MQDLYIQVKQGGADPYPAGMYGIGVTTSNTAQGNLTFGMNSFKMFMGTETYDAVAQGNNVCLAIKGGKLYSWGSNVGGQTGQGVTTGATLFPTQVGSRTDWTIIAAGNSASAGIAGGRLFTWGNNQYGQTGQGTTTGSTNSPTQIGTDTDWTSIDMSLNATVAIKGGKILTCGNNQYGQLGQGLAASAGTNVTTFTELNSGSTGWTVGSISYTHVVGIKSGNLWSAGLNALGRTGQGTASGSTLSITVTPNGATGNFVKASNLTSGTFAITNTGTLWGTGSSTALGGGDAGDPNNFRIVNSDTDWISLSTFPLSTAGYSDSTIANKGNKIFGIGTNANRQFGTMVVEYLSWTEIYNPGKTIKKISNNFYGHAIVLL